MTEKTVPCHFCGMPTQMVRTTRCNRCWEAECRLLGMSREVFIRMVTEVGQARNIMVEIQ